MKRHLAVLLLVVSYGCVLDDEPDEYPPLLDQAGDHCRTDLAMCLDNDTVRECVDGIWTDRGCEESCATLGPAMLSMGCVADGSIDGCVCAPEPGACAPGSTACESNNELGYCDDQQIWTVYDCEELCASSLATPVSVGCDLDVDGVAACWCTA